MHMRSSVCGHLACHIPVKEASCVWLYQCGSIARSNWGVLSIHISNDHHETGHLLPLLFTRLGLAHISERHLSEALMCGLSKTLRVFEERFTLFHFQLGTLQQEQQKTRIRDVHTCQIVRQYPCQIEQQRNKHPPPAAAKTTAT